MNVQHLATNTCGGSSTLSKMMYVYLINRCHHGLRKITRVLCGFGEQKTRSVRDNDKQLAGHIPFVQRNQAGENQPCLPLRPLRRIPAILGCVVNVRLDTICTRKRKYNYPPPPPPPP